MIPFAIAAEPPPKLQPPALVVPGPRQVSFGRVAGTVGAATARIVVFVDGNERAALRPRRGRFSVRVTLPRRDVTVRVVAFDPRGKAAATSVRRVFGLPRAASPAPSLGYEDPVLARRLRALVRAFGGTGAAYVQDLRTGAGAAWNARARFPGASTLKLAIAIELLRVLRGTPTPGSSLDRALWNMLVHSDNDAANALLTRLGGSISGGAGEVNETMRDLGISDSHMYGGYETTPVALRRPIPIRVESQPSFGLGKYTTAWDLARLARYLHLAAGGRGALVRLDGAFTVADARFLLWTLAHSADRGKLDRFVASPAVSVPHKAGWIEHSRHDAGLVYSPNGVFVVSVMTWSSAGVGESADVLAGRVAKVALERFRALSRARAGASKGPTIPSSYSFAL